METVTFTDLQDADHPAVVKALKRRCGVCYAPKNEYCHALEDGFTLPALVHFVRATTHYSTEAEKKRKEHRG